jgi:hypothetical protein
MYLDWIIALAVFVVFFAWSMVYYTNILRPITFEIPDISGDIISFLSIQSWTIPVKFTSANDTNGTVLYATLIWPDGTINSTKVWNGSQYMACNITGNKIYWLTNLTAGDNYFFITFYNQSEPLNCSSELNLTIANLTIPGVAEKSMPISTKKLNQLLNSNYTEIKRAITNRNFALIVDWMNGSIVSYGPNATGNVLYKQIFTKTENGQNLKLKILIW